MSRKPVSARWSSPSASARRASAATWSAGPPWCSHCSEARLLSMRAPTPGATSSRWAAIAPKSVISPAPNSAVVATNASAARATSSCSAPTVRAVLWASALASSIEPRKSRIRERTCETTARASGIGLRGQRGAQVLDAARRARRALGEAELEQHARAPLLGRRLVQRALQQGDRVVGRAAARRLAAGLLQDLGDPRLAGARGLEQLGGDGVAARAGVEQHPGGARVAELAVPGRDLLVDGAAHERVDEAQRRLGGEDLGPGQPGEALGHGRTGRARSARSRWRGRCRRRARPRRRRSRPWRAAGARGARARCARRRAGRCRGSRRGGRRRVARRRPAARPAARAAAAGCRRSRGGRRRRTGRRPPRPGGRGPASRPTTCRAAAGGPSSCSARGRSRRAGRGRSRGRSSAAWRRRGSAGPRAGRRGRPASAASGGRPTGRRRRAARAAGRPRG